MSSTSPAAASRERSLVAAALAGDERAFAELVAPYRRELHLHCYRMLGTLQDAEDALQETLLRAWRRLAGFEGRSAVRAWLYRIATNVCLTALARRGRRNELPRPAGEVQSVELPPGDEGDVLQLAPYPDRLLDELGDGGGVGPEARYEQREALELAFVTAVQVLPARQRAALLLRDVLGFSASEAADLLETSVASVNSALQRARARLEEERREGWLSRRHAMTSRRGEAELVRRFVAAWQAVDIERLVGLLTEEALLTMPPLPLRFVGREAIGSFFATVPAGGRLDRIRLVPTRANRQPALAAYVEDPVDGVHRAYGIMVLSLEGDAINAVVGFADPTLFSRFGLPSTLEV